MGLLAGRRVLVVEDDYVIATDTIGMLEEAGASPIGPIGWLDEALALVSDLDIQFDFAILDVDLHGTPSYQVADALEARGIPFVFATGFSLDAIGTAYRKHARLEKPVSERALLLAMRAQC